MPPDSVPAAVVPAAAFVLAATAGAVGLRFPGRSGEAALGAALLTFGAFAFAISRPIVPVTAAWIPAWSVEMVWDLDGLARAYIWLTLVVAVAVLWYAPGYMRHHIESPPRPPGALTSFFTLFSLFVAAMVGLATSLELLQLFVLWDVTAICSYLLIAFDRHDRIARRAALMALIVTGASATLLLLAAMIFQVAYGTSDLTRLPGLVRFDALTATACACIVVAALAKSAQWPLHFWLPEAMAAPTPVSAYLHAAAMVAAGVFLLQRTQPILAAVPPVGHALVALGWVSMAAGGVLALRADGLKRVLAYSTIAQYGHVVFIIGLGGAPAAAAATFFVLAHGLCKSALFLAAGTITAATGESRLGRVGGLARPLPLLAVATAVAAGGLAGAPLTIGFFKDEGLFAAAHEHGWTVLAAAATGPMFTVAYMWRFWRSIFAGPVRAPAGPVPRALVWPVAALAAGAVVSGFVAGPIVRIADQAAARLGEAHLSAAYHFDLRPSNVAALLAFGAGGLLAWAERTGRLARTLDLAGRLPGPGRLYAGALRALAVAGAWVRDMFPRALRLRVAVIVVSALVLVLIGQISVGITLPSAGWTMQDVPLAAALLLTVTAAVATVNRQAHLAATLSLSLTTLGLAAVFAVIGAPDVALVLVVINVVTTLLILALLHRLPASALEEQRAAPSLWRWRGEDELLAGLAGGLALLVAGGTLGSRPPAPVVESIYLQTASLAHARNVVSAVLVDFRGLDTLGEITVVVISLLTVDAFMRTRRRGR